MPKSDKIEKKKNFFFFDFCHNTFFQFLKTVTGIINHKNLYQWLYSQTSFYPDVSLNYFPSKWGLLQGFPKANLMSILNW